MHFKLILQFILLSINLQNEELTEKYVNKIKTMWIYIYHRKLLKIKLISRKLNQFLACTDFIMQKNSIHKSTLSILCEEHKKQSAGSNNLSMQL